MLAQQGRIFVVNWPWHLRGVGRLLPRPSVRQ